MAVIQHIPTFVHFVNFVDSEYLTGTPARRVARIVSAVPAYYLNWGRYTQLAGQTVLPAVCVVWMALLEAACERPVRRGALLRLLVLSAITTAGLTLTHYRVAVFGACFVLAY